MFWGKEIDMAKKLTMEQWVKACKKVMDQGDRQDFRKMLNTLVEDDHYLLIQCQEQIVNYAIDRGNAELIEEIMENERFLRMRVHLLQMAVEQDQPELLRIALRYVDPNTLIQSDNFNSDENRGSEECDEGTRYYMTAEPLGVCAIQGKVELAKVLLEHGARPEGIKPEDIMIKKYAYVRPFTYAKMDIHLRWKENGKMMAERGGSLKCLPPWAYGLYCTDHRAAEFFLSLGEDRYSLELAMAISLVSDGEIIRILQEKKPKLMAALEPKFILRRFWPQAVKQYFSAEREIPVNAVELMGTYFFEDYDVRRDFHRSFREDDFAETLKYLLTHGYRLTKEDVEQLTMYMVFFRSEWLFHILKGKIPSGMDVSRWIDVLPVNEQSWTFGKQLLDAGIRFRCVIDKDFKCYETKRYTELTRLFKLVDFEIRQPELLDCMSASSLFTRSKRAMALLWKHGLINKENLSQAVKLICDLQLTELYEFSAELAGTTGGSEVRYEL